MRIVSQFGQRSVMRQLATPTRCHLVGCTSGERQSGQTWTSRGVSGPGAAVGSAVPLVLEDEHVALGAVGEDEPFDAAVAHVGTPSHSPGPRLALDP